MKMYKEYIAHINEENVLSKEDFWWEAIRNGNSYDVKRSIAKGIDINMCDNKRRTGLMLAVYFRSLYIAEILLSQSHLDVNLQDDAGWTALMFLTNHINKSVNRADDNYVKKILTLLLLHPDIDVTIKSNVGSTFLDYMINKEKLRNYVLQKHIINNGRVDIILFFNTYNLVHDNIKKQYPHLFTGVDLNLF